MLPITQNTVVSHNGPMCAWYFRFGLTIKMWRENNLLPEKRRRVSEWVCTHCITLCSTHSTVESFICAQRLYNNHPSICLVIFLLLLLLFCFGILQILFTSQRKTMNNECVVTASESNSSLEHLPIHLNQPIHMVKSVHDAL